MRTSLKSLWLVLVLSAASAGAQNNSVPGALELYPTMRAIGVRLAYTGDDNTSSSASIEWRPSGESTWRQGMTMTRFVSGATRRWAGSVLFIAPAAAFDVRVTIADADGSGAPVSASTTTRTEAIPTPAPGANAIWVAPNGSDSNPGTESAPLLSVGLAMSRANAGDQVRLKAGTYYQEVPSSIALRSGTANNYIHLISDVPRAAILDGADPANRLRNDWRDDGGGVYSIAYSGTPRVISVGQGGSIYRLNASSSLANLRTGTIPPLGGSPVSPPAAVNQGWVIEGGRLYIRLEGNVSPIGTPINIARYDIGIFMDANYWHIEGLTFQHYGFSAASSGTSAIRLYAARGTVVHNILASTIGGRGIYVSRDSFDSYISESTFYDSRIGTWPWDASKAGIQEGTAGVALRTGRGHVIARNIVQGVFDGLDTGDGASGNDVAADSDFYDNDISGCGDDGLELEVVSGVNIRAWGNKVHNCFDSLSLAPVYDGPMFILYNTFYDQWKRSFKTSLSGTGHVWIMHNTVWSGRSGFASVWPTGPYSNIHWRNNILSGTGSAAVTDDSGESQTGNDFDGDLLYVTGSSTLFRWKNTNYSSLSALQSATGFETHGKAANPLFVNQAGFDFSLQASSPARDAAVRFPGINDNFTGSAPDIGASEYVSSTSGDSVPPNSPDNLRVQ